jgi:hypothetical protein
MSTAAATNVPGQVYVVDGQPALLLSLQLTPGGSGHGDMLHIGTFSDGKTTWTTDVTDTALEECTEYTAAVSGAGVVAFTRIKPSTPLNEPFWEAIDRAGAPGTLPDLAKCMMSGLTPRQIRGWAMLLFEKIPETSKDLGFSDLAECAYPAETLQLIMWWARRTAMFRLREVVPMGGGAIKPASALVVQTHYGVREEMPKGNPWAPLGFPIIMAARMIHHIGSEVAPPSTTVFETQYYGKESPAVLRKFEALLIDESRAFAHRNLSSSCLAFEPISGLDPWQIEHGYQRVLHPELWKTTAALTAPNAPLVLLPNGEKANRLLTRDYVATVWPKVVEAMCPALKRAVMIKLRKIKTIETDWIKHARSMLKMEMRRRPEYAGLFRDPQAAENSFYPVLLRSSCNK